MFRELSFCIFFVLTEEVEWRLAFESCLFVQTPINVAQAPRASTV